ncbi:helix-turn-helix domain-containing protein [Gordonibacter urolithinfaciens]|uniref:helix-turn-helix domain-containing protein n=1 Tax=Gordonibacter urolithinfaciens TaxID=1335613 RepID=UPI003AAE1F5E
MDVAGQRIRERRLERGWSQTELGRRMGVSKQQVMRYEVHGIGNMRVRRLAALCEVFGCTADELLGRSKNVSRKGAMRMEWATLIWMGSTTLLLTMVLWRLHDLEQVVNRRPDETDHPAYGSH